MQLVVEISFIENLIKNLRNYIGINLEYLKIPVVDWDIPISFW